MPSFFDWLRRKGKEAPKKKEPKESSAETIYIPGIGVVGPVGPARKPMIESKPPAIVQNLRSGCVLLTTETQELRLVDVEMFQDENGQDQVQLVCEWHPLSSPQAGVQFRFDEVKFQTEPTEAHHKPIPPCPVDHSIMLVLAQELIDMGRHLAPMQNSDRVLPAKIASKMCAVSMSVGNLLQTMYTRASKEKT